jgi:hypothetical protein
VTYLALPTSGLLRYLKTSSARRRYHLHDGWLPSLYSQISVPLSVLLLLMLRYILELATGVILRVDRSIVSNECSVMHFGNR